jgi:hypothetical protein
MDFIPDCGLATHERAKADAESKRFVATERGRIMP